MSEKISFYKKIKLFREYRRLIKTHKVALENNFGIRIDQAQRMYTVLNVPEELIGQSYSLIKSDIDKISQNFITEYGTGLAKFLDGQGLSELYQYNEIKKVDKYSYLLVYGFKFFKSHKFYNNLYYKVIPVLSVLVFVLILLLS